MLQEIYANDSYQIYTPITGKSEKVIKAEDLIKMNIKAYMQRLRRDSYISFKKEKTSYTFEDENKITVKPKRLR